MFKKTIKFPGFDNGEEYTEDFYFHLSKAEIAEWRIRAVRDGVDGLEEILEKIKKSKDGNVIMDSFKELLIMSVCKRSHDGKRVDKSPEAKAAFLETNAYDVFFMELVTNADVAAEFVNGIVPADMRDKVNMGVPVSVDLPQTPVSAPNVQLVETPKLTPGDFLTMSPDEFKAWQQRTNPSNNPLGN